YTLMRKGGGVMVFYSPSKGRMSFDEVFEDMMAFVDEDPDARYKVIVGSDSQFGEETCFVTAIIIHREGKGARYYYTRQPERADRSLRQRIVDETARSLGVASQIAERLAEDGHADMNVESHPDVGENGQTRDLIREVVGMVVGSGFDARTKPESFGAMTVADKYTK